MFGLDQIFDFDRNGKLDAFERAAEMAFLCSAEEMKNGLGLVGYVANSIHTVKGECLSAGRIYDRISRKAKGTVKLVLPDAVICRLDK